MRILAILACAALTACAGASGPDYASVMQRCDYATKPFLTTWPCVRSGFQEVDFYADLKAVYIASGDFLAENVSTGKMTDAEAKLAMAEVRQRNYAAAVARENGDPLAKAVVLSSVLNRPNPFASTGPVMAAPTTPLNCYRFGANVQCY